MASRLPSSWVQLRHANPIASSSSLVIAEHTNTIRLRRQPNVVHNLHTTARRGARGKPGWMVGPKGWNTRSNRQNWLVEFNQGEGLPELTTGPAAALKRKEQSTPWRAGVLAIKKGMSAVYQHGNHIPCTVLQLEGCTVVANKTFEKHGYWAVQIGMGSKRPINVGSPLLGYYEAKGVRPMRHLAEFRVRNSDGLLPVGVEIWPDWFHKGQYVDTRSNSRGMGFAGGMKRHGFKGQGKSHGNSKNHRTMGSSGPGQGAGSRVHPGKKMPGRMGNERVTVQNLQVLGVHNELGTVLVKGAVAGPKGIVVKIQDAVKKRSPYPGHMKKMREKLLQRFPHAERHLHDARKRHLQLKQLRKEGNIMKAIEKANEAVAVGAMLTSQEPPPAQASATV
ncbi:putative 50s ribosomal protein l3 protein [Zalerion maritima]|uniref:Large ribosomal subunit protein uL3m n=1 Tax=Zalerion maritima TaxID=339359 RepID=A0AAD5WRL6_9PEZI|nr:putative 50s ribosomal protein l3 protein [Zalerion maritima]